MASQDVVTLAEQVATGFEALQDEYKKLFGQHQSVERKLATAREQYNELAKLCGSGAITTPPLSLASSPATNKAQPALPDVATIIDRRQEETDSGAAEKVRLAATAVQSLRRRSLRQTSNFDGVKIWSGPAADRPELACSTMPSISESPLEQDFTIEGKPSKLGCPFASMAGKKLSSHAASVLSRYNTRESIGAVPSTPLSSVSRVDGRESISRRGSRRASFLDPIKAEICGISDHNDPVEVEHAAQSHELEEQPHVVPVENAEAGVCPIRFLDQHSPEEVATYFEKHKHQLPRSHEVCVRRYQSNEEQIRQLDAKYGNLVSMIQGLGAKHKELLPDEPAEEEEEEVVEFDKKSEEKVRKWASSVSVLAVDGQDAGRGLDEVRDVNVDVDADADVEARRPHFERPLREIRVGESPSRPWGIPVPARYVEKSGSETSTQPVQISSSPAPPSSPGLPRDGEAEAEHEDEVEGERKAVLKARGGGGGKCPLGFDRAGDAAAAAPDTVRAAPASTMKEEKVEVQHSPSPAIKAAQRMPNFLAPPHIQQQQQQQQQQRKQAPADETGEVSRMVFTGPVFIGYSAEDAAKILRGAGLGGPA
ncbi:hypothetical protein LTR78_004213 [Recurvomyces mirabilis]|uniref:Uncharacterized protein n=1 Tax=Recurvomyces mirabilis TaxID=574656 RepID=A0AAE0WQK6_9PEZI|nr:hypothetical protein LTR78_004213 [Recurvomyces mirabilis]KAK5153617.1 hypothetical protein LTS14_007311 [Recurvomyces mirabilis]